MGSTTLGELFEEAEALASGAPDKATEKFMTIGTLHLCVCIKKMAELILETPFVCMPIVNAPMEQGDAEGAKLKELSIQVLGKMLSKAKKARG